jgi:hypothetical protein
MREELVIEVREEKAPLWAVIAPALYLFACALAVRSVVLDRSIDIGVAGVFVTLGFVPAFSVPAIFASRRARLRATVDGLFVDGTRVKLDSARLERAPRGAGRLIVETRAGDARAFVVPSFRDGQAVLALLPAASSPTGALVAS